MLSNGENLHKITCEIRQKCWVKISWNQLVWFIFKIEIFGSHVDFEFERLVKCLTKISDLNSKAIKMDQSSDQLFVTRSCQEINFNCCHGCAEFIADSIVKTGKCKFTKKLKDRYKTLFGFHPRFLNLDSTGQSLCEVCETSWRKQEKVKSIVGDQFVPEKSAVIWKSSRTDHFTWSWIFEDGIFWNGLKQNLYKTSPAMSSCTFLLVLIVD